MNLENMVVLLNVEMIFQITNKGSVLVGTTSIDDFNNLFGNLIGSNILLCNKENRTIELKVIGLDVKERCFGYTDTSKSLNIGILVNEFIDKEYIGVVYRVC